MKDKLVKLVEDFCKHGGKFVNMTAGYSQERGYHCSVIDSHRNALVFCPTHLLVDVNDIGISKAGLFITKPDNYANNISFLEEYFSIHFNAELVEKLLEEKNHINSLSEHEQMLLRKIGLSNAIDSAHEKLEYVKHRILQSHQLTFEPLGKIVIMPFVTFLNHGQDGAPYLISKRGVTVTGKFDCEVLAYYGMQDVLMVLKTYGFVTDTLFIYSLPMEIKLPGGITLQINRDTSKFNIFNHEHRWPVVEKKDSLKYFPIHK